MISLVDVSEFVVRCLPHADSCFKRVGKLWPGRVQVGCPERDDSAYAPILNVIRDPNRPVLHLLITNNLGHGITKFYKHLTDSEIKLVEPPAELLPPKFHNVHLLREDFFTFNISDLIFK